VKGRKIKEPTPRQAARVEAMGSRPAPQTFGVAGAAIAGVPQPQPAMPFPNPQDAPPRAKRVTVVWNGRRFGHDAIGGWGSVDDVTRDWVHALVDDFLIRGMSSSRFEICLEVL
jgi:hypothetical protein